MISGIHISTSEMVIRPGNTQKKLPNFVKGQILLATVLGKSSKGMAQLLINGQKIEAKTSMLLTPGQEVELKVLQEKNEVILKLIGPAQKISTGRLSSLVGLFSKNGTVADIIGTENKYAEMLLHDLALKSDKADPGFLPRLMQKGGMALENKIAKLLVDNQTLPEIKTALENLLKQDLKGALLKDIPGIDSRGSEVSRSVSGFLDTIESFQALNHTNADSGRFLLPFPVFSDNRFQFGQLLIDTGQKNQKEGDGGADNLVRISFLLHMTRLGPMRADFSILKKEITGQFLFEDDETCEYVKSMLTVLKTGLSALEYHVHRLECKTAQKEELQETSLLEPLMKSGGNQVLNIVI